MGSDDGAKVHSQRTSLLRWWWTTPHGVPPLCSWVGGTRAAGVQERREGWRTTLASASIIANVVVVVVVSGLFILGVTILVVLLQLFAPAPELVWTETFTPETAILPPQCQGAKAERFFQCQQEANDSSSATSIVHVLACHRRWCNAWFGGHCDPCMGLGDRMRFLLSQVHEIYNGPTNQNGCKIRIQLDYPVDNVAILQSAVYTDPSGWWGHFFRYRSYPSGTAKRHWPLPSRTISSSFLRHHRETPPRTPLQVYDVSHFAPDSYQPVYHYDPCYFHYLFQPALSLQSELDRHLSAIRRSSNVPSSNISNFNNNNNTDEPPLTTIGIHFRTGDTTAFGVHQNDTRVEPSHIPTAWNAMLHCADELATNLLLPLRGHRDNNDPQRMAGVRYFVATDNWDVKHRLVPSASHGRQIYATDVVPRSTWDAVSGDESAWLELFLLSRLDGLVINPLPQHGYSGTAHRLSYFSMLARNIGFLDDQHVRECNLDAAAVRTAVD